MYRFFNWFWSMVGAYALISGLGLFLAGLSMIDLGYGMAGVIMICVGIPFAFFGARLEHKVKAAIKAGRGYEHKAKV